AGRGQNQGTRSLGPVVGDSASQRRYIYATSSAEGNARVVSADLNNHEIWHHDFANIPGSMPVWNVGGVVFWQTGYFTNARSQDVLVTYRRSMMHSEETLLLAGADGQEIWHRNRQISSRGVGGTPFAVADFDGDGLD